MAKDIKEAHEVAKDAINTLRSCNIPIGSDFFVLSSSQVDALLAYADKVKYRKPRNANGSRGRYFYAMLTRRIRHYLPALEGRPGPIKGLIVKNVEQTDATLTIVFTEGTKITVRAVAVGGGETSWAELEVKVEE